MTVLERSPLTFAAALSVAASAVLALVPVLSPSTPIAPFVVANWLPFIAVGYLARQNRIVFWVVLLAFALAGWLAILHAKVII